MNGAREPEFWDTTGIGSASDHHTYNRDSTIHLGIPVCDRSPTCNSRIYISDITFGLPPLSPLNRRRGRTAILRNNVQTAFRSSGMFSAAS
jgi:hypothetical protein